MFQKLITISLYVIHYFWHRIQQAFAKRSLDWVVWRQVHNYGLALRCPAFNCRHNSTAYRALCSGVREW